MNSSPKLLLKTIKGEKTERAPFWFMRQAGRYLPEYKELRSKAKDFLDFCYTPSMACEATLQPIRRFGMDGAIIFSDILVVPHALGADVRFEEGSGPVLKPVQTAQELKALNLAKMDNHLAPVYEALRQTSAGLPKETTLIGFVGAPWTLACYLVQGKAGRDFEKVRSIAITDHAFFKDLIVLLTQAVAKHAINQIDAGAEVIQIFDSWAGNLSEEQFDQWVIAPTIEIVKTIRAAHPGIPIIGFPRLAGSKFTNYIRKTAVDAVTVDTSVSLDWAREALQPVCAVQGNLDPLLLAGDKDAMLAQAKRIVSKLGIPASGKKSFIFNLGHGILPHTPVEHVRALCDFLKNPSACT
jgi:uroporphyrinogen decarboxylase